MTTLNFIGLGFPSNCVDTILNGDYIQFSEPIVYESLHMNLPPGFVTEQQLFQSNMSPQPNHSIGTNDLNPCVNPNLYTEFPAEQETK